MTYYVNSNCILSEGKIPKALSRSHQMTQKQSINAVTDIIADLSFPLYHYGLVYFVLALVVLDKGASSSLYRSTSWLQQGCYQIEKSFRRPRAGIFLYI